MLFKEKILLSNCDSVKKHSQDEVRKRLLVGLVFGNGVVLSPNILFDNIGIQSVLNQKNVIKFLNEEGLGEFIVRGFNIGDIKSASEYFEKLPNNYAVSSLNGKLKGNLSITELNSIKKKITTLDGIIEKINPTFENASISQDSLTNEIRARISNSYFKSDEEFKKFLDYTKKFTSRSDWYNYVDNNQRKQFNSAVLKQEVIDPSYNSLFVNKGEGFVQDNIETLLNIPEKILSAGVSYKSIRKEIELIDYPIKAFEIISSLGSTELLKIITDEALGYIEDKTKDTSLSFFSRKNWFGLYPVLRNKMGVEIK